MTRPRKPRTVRRKPGATYFKPRAVPLSTLKEVTISVGELEAIHLSDAEGKDQKEAAEEMNISQPTFSRLLASARKKAAEALYKGKAIKVEGGEYKLKED